MSAILYTLDAANLFVGDHDPSNSQHLAIRELKLPDLRENFVDHHPGGARAQIELSVGIQKLTPTFRLAGHDPKVLTQFGLSTRRKQTFTAYGEMINRRSGDTFELKSVMEGRLGSIEGDAFQKGEVTSHSYAINEVTHYELWWANVEKIYWDFWTNTWRVDGVDQNATTNSILRIGR